jgi:hypothetical protein
MGAIRKYVVVLFVTQTLTNAVGRYGTGFKPGPFMSRSSVCTALLIRHSSVDLSPADQLGPRQPSYNHDLHRSTHSVDASRRFCASKPAGTAPIRRLVPEPRRQVRSPAHFSFGFFSDGRCLSFSSTPNGGGDSDLRNLYSAFAICALLGDWSSIDVERAIGFIASCRVRRLHSTALLRFFSSSHESVAPYTDIRGRLRSAPLVRGAG